MTRRSRKPNPKGKARRTRQKVKARVSRSASIVEFSRAALDNLEERYWEYAEPVLQGLIAPQNYPAAAANLNALREAGEIIKATLLEQNDDEDEDDGKK